MPGGPGREFQLRLYRDGLNTPWGFRLKGGKDLKQPLVVQKIAAGSPVDGELFNGDVLLEIQNCDAGLLTHTKAQEMIKNSGGSLLVRLRRSGYHDQQQSVSASIGPQQGFMMHRLQDSLSGVIHHQHHSNFQIIGVGYQQNDHPYSTYPTVADRFSTRQNPSSPTSYVVDRSYSTLPKPRNPPQLPSGLAEPGWTPRSLTGAHPPPSRGGRTRPNPQPSFVVSPQRAATVPRALEPETPAWMGSLKSSANPHLSDMSVRTEPHGRSNPQTEIARFSPSSSSDSPYQPRIPPQSHDSQTARAAHLQYNSPLGLYSKMAASEAMKTQLCGKPGYGTLQVKSESDVYSLVHDDDNRNSRGHQGSADSYTDF